jgi:hypothetical protein
VSSATELSSSKAQGEAHSEARRTPVQREWQLQAALLFLAVFFVQAVTAVPRLSLTADEPVYMGAGYAFLRSGDLRLATAAQHPPLLQELVALPLLLGPGPDLEAVDGWSSGEMARYAPAFVAWYGEGLDAATFAARLPVIGLAMIWGAFLFRWAADWFGPWGGMAALALFAFDPNILAHAGLATNDVGFAALSFITLFFADRFLNRWRMTGRVGDRRSWIYLLLTGMAVGGSLGSKSSGFFTVLVLAGLFALRAWAGGPGRPRRLMGATIYFSLVLIVGLSLLWATYGFEFGAVREGGLPVPMPTQWKVWREMRVHLSQGHTGYLMGQIRDGGWLIYYPLAFVLKTPLFTLLGLALGLVVALARGPRHWLAMSPLWLFVGAYLAATLLSSVTTGYRFLLPLLPFVFLLIAALFQDGLGLFSATRLRGGALAGLALAGALVSLSYHPHFLTFFNLLAGGPAHGHEFLVDSNLDWGQSFKALEGYLERRGGDGVRLSYYTYADPALYGVPYRPLPPAPDASPLLARRFNPPPGLYAVGATTLHGVLLVDPDTFSWFRQRQPVARPGNAIFVYEVEAYRPSPAWLAQCTVPAPPLTPQAATEGFGSDDLRLAYFDCTQSWLWPTGGEAPGSYALHGRLDGDEDPFVHQALASARLSYRQRVDSASPAFDLYEQPVAPLPAGCDGTPLPLGGPLEFLGQISPRDPAQMGDTVEITTCWRVTALPGRPLSLMLHVVGPGGAPLLVGDGLGVPTENWRVGDVILQRHRLTLPVGASVGAYQVYTGAYWLDTLERWPVVVESEPAGDRITLSPLSVVASR